MYVLTETQVQRVETSRIGPDKVLNLSSMSFHNHDSRAEEATVSKQGEKPKDSEGVSWRQWLAAIVVEVAGVTAFIYAVFSALLSCPVRMVMRAASARRERNSSDLTRSTSC